MSDQLGRACILGDLVKVKKILRVRPAEMGRIDEHGENALSLALRGGSMHVVAYLLDRNAKPPDNNALATSLFDMLPDDDATAEPSGTDDSSLGGAPACTFCFTGGNMCQQRMFECTECEMDAAKGFGLCEGCARSCHADHKGVRFVAFGRGYCDCGHSGCKLASEGRQDAVEGGQEVVMDNHSRVSGATDSGLDFGFRCFQMAGLDRTQLSSACKEMAKSIASLPASGPTVAPTFWLPADATPQNPLEELASAVFRLHTKGLPAALLEGKRSGAEWWVQHRPAGGKIQEAGLGFHYDKDEFLAEKGIGVYPALSTVTYLSDSGAPTVILNNLTDMPVGSPIKEGYVSHPQSGKHIVFDGRFLHGVPAVPSLMRPDFQPSDRLTFLVNIWIGHAPRSVQRIPESVNAAISPLDSIKAVSFKEMSHETIAVTAGTDTTRPVALAFKQTSLTVNMRLPAVLKESAETVALQYGAGTEALLSEN